MSNYQLITEGFQILRSSLAPYIARSLIKVYGDDNWWRKGVWERLYDYQRRNIPETGTYGELVDSLDVAVCLLLLDINWRSLFSNQLSRDCLTWIKELRSSRNGWAHFGGQQPTARDAWRSLDTMSRLCREVDQDAVDEIENLINGIGFEGVILPGEGDVPANDSGPIEDPSHQQSDVGEQFEYLPKQKASWKRDEILEVAKAWAAAHARFLPARIERWHPATLADTVLSKCPGQSDMATRFSDSQPETLFAPDARKLRIVTHI